MSKVFGKIERFSEDIDLGKPRKKRQAVQIKRPLPFSDIAKNLMSFYELSGSEFSQMVETGAYSVNRWIKGETCPRLKNIDKIIRECEITPSQAMGFEGKIFDVPDKDEEFLKARDVDSFKKAEGRDTKEVHTDTDQAVLETLQKALGEDPPKAEKKPEVKKEPKERAPKSRAKKEVVREIGLDQSPLMIEAVHKLTAIPKDDIEAVLNAYNCALDVRSVFGI